MDRGTNDNFLKLSETLTQGYQESEKPWKFQGIILNICQNSGNSVSSLMKVNSRHLKQLAINIFSNRVGQFKGNSNHLRQAAFKIFLNNCSHL